MKVTRILGILLCSIGLITCTPTKQKEALFTIVNAEESGITFQNTLESSKRMNILDYLYFYNGAGVSVGDIDNDGRVDIYLTANQGPNKLYRNIGDFRFEDITEKAGVQGTSEWNTGTVMADVNGDGWLDIYVCAVTGIQGLEGTNELFINNGNGTFTEKAADFGLDLQNYSSMASFFDYDNDGDLDMYLLNHAVHTIHSYGNADTRNKRHEESGDKLFRNDAGTFVDVSEEAGIYGGVNGYGLAIATADFNNDGYTDMYISNDFHEDDYYYINQGDGTFLEQSKAFLGQQSRFSMGSDVADINQDGYMDLLTLDMATHQEEILKTSVGDETTDIIKLRTERLGYHHQYARNMLQINQGDHFAETALFSGVSHTDWSWGALFADYNNDGLQDLFISNGIPKRPNDLDYIKYISNEEIQQKLEKTQLIDNDALAMMPSGAIQNYIFEGKKGIQFKDQSSHWIPKDTIISNGAAYADFDNDGDLDIITNNLNAPVTLYRNQSDSTTAKYLTLHFNYKKPNPFGIGTKVISYHQGIRQYKQLYNARGFQSSSTIGIHFGYDAVDMVDSLQIIWPDQTIQTVSNVKTNQILTLQPLSKRETVTYAQLFPKPKPWFQKVDSIPGLSYVHLENEYIDVNRHKLIPYQISDRGPATAVGDLNGDGKEDLFFGNGKHQPAVAFIQQDDGSFLPSVSEAFRKDQKKEDIAAIIEDVNGDGNAEIMVTSGGGEFYGKAEALRDRMYSYTDEQFEHADFPEYYEHGSVIAPYDIDQDGDVDLFIGGHAQSNDFGAIPKSYLLKNDSGRFTIDEMAILAQIGMVTDAVWSDFDGDQRNDLIVIGEWMAPRFFKNNNGKLEEVTAQVSPEKQHGLWQKIVPFDIDRDGDLDYILGNFGLNTKFKASAAHPMRMYYGDLDGNGKTETVVAIAKDGAYYTLAGLDELAGQLNYLKKKFPAYRDFAGKTVSEVFGEDKLKNTQILEVHELASGYLKNDNGTFQFIPFTEELQLAPITAMKVADYNSDGHDEVLLAGNYYGVTPFHGRLDAFAGAMLQDETQIHSARTLGIDWSKKSIRDLHWITIAGKKYLIVTVHNAKVEVYTLTE